MFLLLPVIRDISDPPSQYFVNPRGKDRAKLQNTGNTQNSTKGLCWFGSTSKPNKLVPYFSLKKKISHKYWQIILTDQIMEDCIFCVTVWYGVLGVEYSQFSRIFKWVLHKAKKKQNATKGLKGQIINNYWMRLSMISWIIKIKVCVICRRRRLRQITQTKIGRASCRERV